MTCRKGADIQALCKTSPSSAGVWEQGGKTTTIHSSATTPLVGHLGPFGWGSGWIQPDLTRQSERGTLLGLRLLASVQTGAPAACSPEPDSAISSQLPPDIITPGSRLLCSWLLILSFPGQVAEERIQCH